MSVNKQADSGMPDVSAHRELSPHEEEALEAGKSRWLPRIFQSYGTPIPDLMASPLKTGLIFGLPAGIIGAGLGSAIGGAASGKNYSSTGALLGGLGAGGLAALAAGMDREAKNEGLEELMRRMPEGAAKRDLLADPQYQADFLGWDNNKIVATARARYYRPTERFSKRTFDMADARARYNERHKSSSVNKDVSMSEKQALIGPGTLIGAAGGAATGNPGDRWRSAGRGAIKGFGWDVGGGTGAGLGALLGIPFGPAGIALGAGLGYGGGGMVGKNLAGAMIGPYETEEEKLERLLAARSQKKQVKEVESGENKKAAHALLNNKTLTLAEKMAAYKNLLLKQADEPIPLGPGAAPVDMPAVNLKPAPMPGPRSTAGQRVVTPPYAMGGESSSAPSAPSLPLPGVNHAAMLVTSGGSAPAGAPRTTPSAPTSNQPSTAEILKHLVGAGDRRSTFYDEGAKRLGQLNDARLSAGKYIGENALYPAAKGLYNAPAAALGLAKYVGGKGQDAVSAGLGAGRSLAKWLKPDAPPPPGLLEQLKPYAPYAAVGAGGLGALALADYLSRGKKKKRRPEPRDEEYDMPKAASVNWYELARQRQKYAMSPAVAKPIVSLGPNILARLAALRSGAGSLATRGRDAVAGLPTWAKVTGGLGLAGGTGAGIGALGGMFTGKDPSMLEQIMKSKYTPYAAAGLGTAGLLGGAAYMGSRAGKNDAKKKKKPEGEKEANLGLGAGVGAGLGGAAGALYGALAPGYEQDPDSGRRRRRSRLVAALRGLAGGAAAGGLAGGAVGHFAGPSIEKILGEYLAKKQQAGDAAESGLRTDVTMQADPVEVAKAEAMKQPAPPAIPQQGPMNANATLGGQLPAQPGVQNSMPPDMSAVQNVMTPPNPMPTQSPAIPQGPMNANATMGGMPAPQIRM